MTVTTPFVRARLNAPFGLGQYYGDPNSDGTWTDWRSSKTSGTPSNFLF